MSYPFESLGYVTRFGAWLFTRPWTRKRRWRILVWRCGQGISGLQVLVSGEKVGLTDELGLSDWLCSLRGSRIEVMVYDENTSALVYTGLYEVPDTEKSIFRINLDRLGVRKSRSFS